jgi:hypothetical protein
MTRPGLSLAGSLIAQAISLSVARTESATRDYSRYVSIIFEKPLREDFVANCEGVFPYATLVASNIVLQNHQGSARRAEEMELEETKILADFQTNFCLTFYSKPAADSQAAQVFDSLDVPKQNRMQVISAAC